MSAESSLEDRVNDALPQTQCARCGYPDCRSYATAITQEAAPINQCPPGGREGIARLSELTGRAADPLNPAHGKEGPLKLARIQEESCIGCTLCLDACPVDCIIGGAKSVHTVMEAQCTGCELCLPACPVDCITVIAINGPRTGWSAWSEFRAQEARARYLVHQARRARVWAEEHGPRAAAAQPELKPNQPLPARAVATLNTRRRAIEDALRKARERRSS